MNLRGIWLNLKNLTEETRGPAAGIKGRCYGRIRACAVTALLLFFAALPAAHAQVSASIKGAVRDPSGAPVPSAAVTAKDVETGAVRNSTTDEAGRYQLLALAVGEYEVSVTKPGFRVAIRGGIHLAVGQEAIVDLRLLVGEVKEHVTVTEEAPIVSTTTKDISGLVA